MPRGINQFDEDRLDGLNVGDANSSNIVSPGIVTDGLVLHLDAGNYQSYPIAGTTWYDLSDRRNNGTLTNGPTYDRDGGGAINFDGSNDYAACGNPSISAGKITANAWAKITTGSIIQHVVDSSSINPFEGWHLAILSTNRPYFYNGVNYHTTASVLSTGVWYMLTGVQGATLDIYINGVLSQSISDNRDISTGTINLGRWQQDGTRLYAGKIAQASVYNRALTPVEILQNYNATRARFNI